MYHTPPSTSIWHTYPDMNKVASQIINLDNFCETAFLCLFDTSTSILIPLYIWEDRRKTLSSQFTCQKRGQKFMNVNFKKNQKYSWPFGFGLLVARIKIKDLLHCETRCVLSNCLPVKMGSCRVCNARFSPLWDRTWLTNVTVHMCMTSSDVVLQQELCIEFPLTCGNQTPFSCGIVWSASWNQFHHKKLCHNLGR